MVTLIMGGSGSGKSAYAEEYISRISGDCRKYYIATMLVFDREAQAKVRKHQRMRMGRGFWTIEQQVTIDGALHKMEAAYQKESAALLECISNLTANEMFSGKEVKGGRETAEKVIHGVERLKEGLKHLVIVTNNVFEDGIIYDDTTTEYIRAMGSINRKLADMADQVIEVVVGIPIVVKDEK